MGADKRFQIALSFPGERRAYVARVAQHLAEVLGRERVLYDRWHEAEFARPDLDTYLQDLYHRQSELIAVFLCADYERKDWCGGVEWRAVKDLIKRRDGAAIMPLRFDATEIPGLFSTDGYIWLGDDRDSAEVAGLILQRWRLNGGAVLAPPAAIALDEDHDYQTRLESALAKLLDHRSQLVGAEKLLAARADRVLIGVVECSAEDWPSYLAHHLQCAHATDPADAILSEAIELNLRRRSDARAVWCALVETANAVSATSDDARRTAVRALLAGPGLRVLYAHVDVKLHGRNLAALIDGAAADLRALGELGTETRVLLLLGAGRDPERPPFWWRWRHRHAVRRRDCCHALQPMAPLTGEDVEGWYQDFPALLRHCLDRDRIKTELLDLFAEHGAVRYQRVRKRLLGDGVADLGALRRARLRPCNRSAR
jgi:hypothetical protein